MTASHDEWAELERAAKRQISADLDVLEATPLEFGAFIAWVGIQRNCTDRLSVVHRVGFPQIGRPYTACGMPVPAPLLWVPLSQALVRTMKNCTYCNAEIGRAAREQAA